eukprot:54877-Eustigmatos_ZCMA.PRE.1
MSEPSVSVRRFSRSKREEDDEEQTMAPTPAPSPDIPPEDDLLFEGDSIVVNYDDSDDDKDDFLKDLKGGNIPDLTHPPKAKKQTKKTVKFDPESAVDMGFPVFHPAPESALMSEF